MAVERSLAVNTLTCFLQGLRGSDVIVELQNGDQVRGKVDNVDGYGNVELVNARLAVLSEGHERHLAQVTLTHKRIRYVRFPSDVDVKRTIERQIDVIRGTDRIREQKARREKFLARKEKQKAKDKAALDLEQLRARGGNVRELFDDSDSDVEAVFGQSQKP